MTDPRNHPRSDHHDRVQACRRDVSSAREQLRLARSASPGWDLRGLRAELLRALEAYAAAISHMGAPVPPALHSEIELYRQLGDRA